MSILLFVIAQLCITPYVFGGDDVIIDMSDYPIVRNATPKDLIALEKYYDHDDNLVKSLRKQTMHKHLQEQTSHFVWLWKTTAKKPLVLEQYDQIQAVLLYKLIEQPSWYDAPSQFFLVETIKIFSSTSNHQTHTACLLSHLQNNKEKFPVRAVAAIGSVLRHYNFVPLTHGESV